MHDMYIDCIDYNDYKRLGQYIFMLSSVSLTEMVSYYRKVRGINPDELNLSNTTKQKKQVVVHEQIDSDYLPSDDDIKIYQIKR